LGLVELLYCMNSTSAPNHLFLTASMRRCDLGLENFEVLLSPDKILTLTHGYSHIG
jgi:hypothetical protein